MKRIIGVFVVLSILVAIPAAAGAASPRSLWVWEGPIDGVVEFANSKAITDLYVSAPPGFSSDARYLPFIEAAHAAGMRVHAVAGDATWARRGNDWVDWTNEVVNVGAFDGIVADVEPYLLSEWSNARRRGRVIKTYLANLSKAHTAAGATPMLAAVPFWWDLAEFSNSDGTLIERVMQNSDGVVVMAYRDFAEGADGIIEHADFEVDLADTLGKTVVVGVETGAASLDKVTFAEEGETAMEAELVKVEGAFASVASYGGIAIHYYGSYATMAP